jgi:hypothetical protein
MASQRRLPSAGHSHVVADGLHAEEPAAREELATKLQRSIQIVSSIVAPVTVLTALMVHFGHTYMYAVLQYFGIDVRLLELSNEDYLLQTGRALWAPIGILLLVGLISLCVHDLVAKMLIRRSRLTLRVAATALGLSGLALLSMGAAGVVSPDLFGGYGIIPSLGVWLGAAIGGYGGWLWRRLSETNTQAPIRPPWLGATSILLVTLLVIIGLFWTVTEFASALGRGDAEVRAEDLAGRPAVTVYSIDRLFLQGPGVIETTLPVDAHAGYHYRYDGLRLLTDSQDHFFLLPAGWTPGRTPTIMLDRNDKIRIEFTPGSGA